MMRQAEIEFYLSRRKFKPHVFIRVELSPEMPVTSMLIGDLADEHYPYNFGKAVSIEDGFSKEPEVRYRNVWLRDEFGLWEVVDTKVLKKGERS